MLRFIFVFIVFFQILAVGAPPLWAASTSPLPTAPSAPAGSVKQVVPAVQPAVVSKIAPAPVPAPATTDRPSDDNTSNNSGGQIAQDDPYTVHGVKVDVTAETSMKARDKAFMLGQQTAFMALAKNLSGSDTVKMVDDARIGKLVKSFEVESERASGTRYTATLTYHFKPQATAALLGKDGAEISDDPYNKPKKADGIQALSATTMPPERVLVLPILRMAERSILWEEKTPWHKAWDNVLSDRPAPDLIIPEGTIEDVGAITASEALAGLNLPLTRIMRKYQARGIIVAALIGGNVVPQSSQNLSIQLARFDDRGKMIATITIPVPAEPRRKDIEWLQSSVVSAINAWRDSVAKLNTPQPLPAYGVAQPAMPTATAPGQFLRVALTVPFANMEEWAAKRETLQAIPGMAALEVKTMNRYRAVVQIDYTGAQSQLDQALSTRNMQILPTNPPDGTYMLSSTGQPQIMNPAQNQPVFTTVYPSNINSATQPPQGDIPAAQIQTPHIQPVGQPQLLPDDAVQDTPLQQRFENQ